MLADTKIEKDMKGLILRHTEFVIAVRQKILIYTFLEPCCQSMQPRKLNII